MEKVGKTAPECPYCGADLEKMPAHKKKCPACKQFIYVRTRPSDNKKILIREDQILAVEESWSIKNGTHEQFLAERRILENEREALRLNFGKEPSDNDIEWSLLNKKLIRYAAEKQLGMYRNAKLAMGIICKREDKVFEALNTYLEVCYIDLSGPMNCINFGNPKYLIPYLRSALKMLY